LILIAYSFNPGDREILLQVSLNGLTADVWEDKRLKPVKKRAKDHYIAQQYYRCCYCQVQIPSMNNRLWDMEHVVPKSLHPGFLFEPRNLAVSCPDCNNAKANKETLVDPNSVDYPASAEFFMLVHPHLDQWDSHIRKNGDVFKPLTERGTWTVKECNLGRFGLMQLDPSDVSNPSDLRFEQAVEALTADPATARAALELIESYLTALPMDPLA
jgi:hypothetical protein